MRCWVGGALVVMVAGCGATAPQATATNTERGDSTSADSEPAEPAAITRTLPAGARGWSQIRFAEIWALPAVSRQLERMTIGDDASLLALARLVDRVVLIEASGDAMGGIVVVRSDARSFAEQVAAIQQTTLDWSAAGRAHLDSPGADEWELRLVGETIVVFWGGQPSEWTSAPDRELAQLARWPDDVLVFSASRERDFRRFVTVRRDLTVHIDALFDVAPTSAWLEENVSALLADRWLESAGRELQVQGARVTVDARANEEELAALSVLGAVLLSGRPLFGGFGGFH